MSFKSFSLVRTDEAEYTDKVLKGEKYLAVMLCTCREVNYLIKKQVGFHPGTFHLPSIVLYYSLATSQVLTVQSSKCTLLLASFLGFHNSFCNFLIFFLLQAHTEWEHYIQ